MPTAPQHRRLKHSVERDTRRVSASEAGYDWQWSKPGGTADQVRERDEWQCVVCKSSGIAIDAVLSSLSRRQLIVDHIIPAHRIPADKFHDLGNLQTLCPKHHADKTAADMAKYGSAKR